MTPKNLSRVSIRRWLGKENRSNPLILVRVSP